MDIRCNTAELEMRYRAINTHFQSTFVLPIEKPEFKKLRLIDLDDPASLKEIISKFFELTPIDLDRLRWIGYMRKNWKYKGLLISVSSFLLFFLICVIIGLYILIDSISTNTIILLSVKEIVCVIGLVVSFISMIIFNRIDKN